MQLQTLLKIIYAAIMPCRQGPVNDVAYHGTCEDQPRNHKTAEVCFSVSHEGRDSPSGAKFDPEPNRLLQCLILLRVEKFEHISTLMRDELQWLRVDERIRFKLSNLMHKYLNNSTPPYLVDKIRSLSDDCNRSWLRSSNSSDVLCLEPRLKWRSGLSGCWSTDLEQSSCHYSVNQNSSCFQK